jgi:transcription elongation factor Elf1
MKRTEIMCPECMSKKLLTTTDDKVNENRTWCDNCGTDFILTGPTSVRYK